MEIGHQIILFLQQFMNPLFNIGAALLQILGEKGIIFMLICVGLTFNQRTRRAGIVTLLIILFASATTEVLKHVVERPRPYITYPDVIQMFDASDFKSFPSGHATAAFAFATGIGFYFKKWRIPVYTMAILMAVSRVYAGVHFPSDVIMGATIGCIWGFIIIFISEKLFYQGKH